jgi:hypothetical protein
MSTTGNGVLLSSMITSESGSEFFEKLAHWCSFIKLWHSSPPFFLSQTMADRFHRVPPDIHIPWRSAFFSFKIRLQWSDQLSCKINDEQMKLPSRGVLNLIWKIAIPTTTSP